MIGMRSSSPTMAKRLAACDDAIALLREIANQETDDDGNVILGTEARSSNDLMSRIVITAKTEDD